MSVIATACGIRSQSSLIIASHVPAAGGARPNAAARSSICRSRMPGGGPGSVGTGAAGFDVGIGADAIICIGAAAGIGGVGIGGAGAGIGCAGAGRVRLGVVAGDIAGGTYGAGG